MTLYAWALFFAIAGGVMTGFDDAGYSITAFFVAIVLFGIALFIEVGDAE